MGGMKIIKGLEEALQVAKCDHHMVPANLDIKDPSVFQRWYCDRCQAIFYTSFPNGE